MCDKAGTAQGCAKFQWNAQVLTDCMTGEAGNFIVTIADYAILTHRLQSKLICEKISQPIWMKGYWCNRRKPGTRISGWKLLYSVGKCKPIRPLTDTHTFTHVYIYIISINLGSVSSQLNITNHGPLLVICLASLKVFVLDCIMGAAFPQSAPWYPD